MTGPDKYESVLGLPPSPRPLNHYELLGLEPFESSESIIAAAADRRIVDAEESVLASAEHIRQVVSEIRAAKTCLLNQQSKADYDRGLKPSAAEDEPIELERADPAVDQPHAEMPHNAVDEPQFEPLPTDLIVAGRPQQSKSRKFRVWFWTFTLVEGLCVVGLFLYLRPVQQVAVPNLPVADPVVAEQPKADSPPVAQPARRQRKPIERAATGDPFAPPPGDPFAPAEADHNDDSPVLTDRQMPEGAIAASTGGIDEFDTAPIKDPPAPVVALWPREWTLHFSVYGDWTIDNEMLSLSADEVKALAALREQPIYTLRDASNKKPMAALPFDAQGHLNGVAVALLPKNDWRACLTYNNGVLQGWAMILDAQRECVCFGEYRNKGRTKLLCLCAEGIPVAVQIWRNKEFSAFLIELVDGQPVARAQNELSPEQAERLAAALVELASIESLIRDREREWKGQLTEWWSKHDNALRTITAQPVDEGVKQSRKTAYYKKLFDEQHAGLDKLLAQFGTVPVDPPVPTP